MARIHTVTVLEMGEDGIFRTVFDHSYDIQHIPIRADKSLGKQAKGTYNQANTAQNLATGNAAQERGTLIPAITRDVTNPTGLTPTQRNQYMVSTGEATGGVNAGLTGEANLAAARTRQAGGFSPALAEAARQKMRSAATATQDVNKMDVELANRKRAQALQQLQGLYGTDTSNALRAMGLEDEAIKTEMEANAAKPAWMSTVGNYADLIGKFGGGIPGIGKFLPG